MILDHSVFGRALFLFFPDADLNEYSGYKVRMELKRSVRDHIHFLSDCYVGVEVFHTRNHYGTEVRFNTDPMFEYPDDERIGTVSYGEELVIDKLRTGINLKFGAMQRAGNHFFVEPHIGLGLVYRDVRHYERMNPNDSTEDKGIWDWQEKGTKWVLNLPFNCKLGWAF